MKILAALGTMLLIAASAFAQNAELRGTVSDESGAVLPGVSVTVRNVETGVTRTLVSDASGSFTAPSLLPGPYRVTSELMGFKTDVKLITLTVGQVAELRITMAVGAVSEVVEVKGTVEMVDTSKSDLSAVVTTQQLAELPVLNRGFIGLAQLLPGGGPSRTGDMRFGIQTAFGGTNVRSMYSTLVDGSNMDHPVYGFSIVNVNQDAVQEFRVMRNQYDAQYSRAGTAVVNVLTRSGTNTFHGSGSYFGRDVKLNAQNAFAKSKPPFNLTRLSGTVGGPIQLDKAHFFTAVEYLRTNYSTLISLNPSNPFASTWNGSYPAGDREKTLAAKVNYQLNDKHAVSVRYLMDLLRQDYSYVQAQNYDNRVHDVSALWNWTLSGSRLNTVTAQVLPPVHQPVRQDDRRPGGPALVHRRPGDEPAPGVPARAHRPERDVLLGPAAPRDQGGHVDGARNARLPRRLVRGRLVDLQHRPSVRPERPDDVAAELHHRVRAVHAALHEL